MKKRNFTKGDITDGGEKEREEMEMMMPSWKAELLRPFAALFSRLAFVLGTCQHIRRSDL